MKTFGIIDEAGLYTQLQWSRYRTINF